MADIPFDKRDGFIWFNGELVPLDRKDAAQALEQAQRGEKGATKGGWGQGVADDLDDDIPF